MCGILAEMDTEIDKVNSVNLGIGINANAIISDYEKKATSIREELGREISRKEFFFSLLREISEQQTLLTKADLLEEGKSLSSTLNKDVKIVAPGEEIVGRATDIDTTGALIVESHDGSLREVFAGDCIHLSS